MPYVPQYLEIGATFGHWTVLDEFRDNSGVRIRRVAICRCVCGSERMVLVNELKHGKSTNCGCLKHAKRLRGRTKEERDYERHIRMRYGIDLDDKDLIASQQDNVCAICCRDRPLVVDHDHVTGRVRGLLCQQCNHALGLFSDNPDTLSRALTYIRDRAGINYWDSHVENGMVRQCSC